MQVLLRRVNSRAVSCRHDVTSHKTHQHRSENLPARICSVNSWYNALDVLWSPHQLEILTCRGVFLSTNVCSGCEIRVCKVGGVSWTTNRRLFEVKCCCDLLLGGRTDTIGVLRLVYCRTSSNVNFADSGDMRGKVLVLRALQTRR